MIKNDKLKSRLKKYIILKGDIMRSITKIELQYAHRFYGFKGEAQYLHGHNSNFPTLLLQQHFHNLVS